MCSLIHRVISSWNHHFHNLCRHFLLLFFVSQVYFPAAAAAASKQSVQLDESLYIYCVSDLWYKCDCVSVLRLRRLHYIDASISCCGLKLEGEREREKDGAKQESANSKSFLARSLACSVMNGFVGSMYENPMGKDYFISRNIIS